MANTYQTIMLMVGILGSVIGVATFVAGMIARAKNDGRFENKIDYACKGIDDIKTDLKLHSDRLTVHEKCLGVLENSLKSAHHRIDEVSKRIEDVERK